MVDSSILQMCVQRLKLKTVGTGGEEGVASHFFSLKKIFLVICQCPFPTQSHPYGPDLCSNVIATHFCLSN